MIQIQSFTFNPFSENTYVVLNEEKDAFIIDPGNFGEDETGILNNFIAKNQLKVKNIVLTHAHIDHVLGLQTVHDHYQVPVLMHETEKEILDRNPMDANRFGFFFSPFSGEIQFLKEGETINLGEDLFEILHVPGHSPGHIALHNQAQKFVISGDVLFEGSIGRTDLYKGNHEQLLESIKTKLFVLDGDTKVFSGHGNPTAIGFEKKHNPFF
ncbi:MBL fold metallo-hydrolase [Chryseobacterium koreense]|uniref:Metallo-beta-lactamase n=1 Tax=Chryseobacterium koreense CCUG 49689 TaxID=1304281 RepID=A0A0J7IY74_9FLAO|nr:MBL fold metallo-hydrolase [Chryseobacterium koreense]KMQ70776.1 metallo-beta-lactamase [Chryseobacterium koreense CCUG 49689]MBB5333674.1 glyoxylase-like metal-dependent hydrolase (beta-lactamase superfamily II) [Chryseobacterium koreense]